MDIQNKVAKIFTMAQEFPCGPKSSCCGPVGQTEQEVDSLKSAIGKLGLEVSVYDVSITKNLEDSPQVSKVLRTFGPKVIPIITIGDEIASMGQAETDEIISAIKSKL